MGEKKSRLRTPPHKPQRLRSRDLPLHRAGDAPTPPAMVSKMNERRCNVFPVKKTSQTVPELESQGRIVRRLQLFAVQRITDWRITAIGCSWMRTSANCTNYTDVTNATRLQPCGLDRIADEEGEGSPIGGISVVEPAERR